MLHKARISLSDDTVFEVNDDFVADHEITEDIEKKLRESALRFASVYFKDKTLFVGGEITEQILATEKRILTILNSNMLNSVDEAHKGISKNQDMLFKASLEGSDGQAKLIIDILAGIASCQTKIPKEFAGGILLLHLELVEGVIFES